MRIAKLFLSVVTVVLVLVFGTMGLIERVEPATIGVRQSLWGGGYAEKDFHAGFHLGVWGLHKWHFLDRRTHFLTWSDGGQSTSMGMSLPPLEIRTKDNNTASFDLTFTYKIQEEGGYKIVQQGEHEGNRYRQRVISAVEGILREQLANMASEEIYSTENRLERAEAILPVLREELQQYYVMPESILIRAVRFPQGYEKRLQEKQLTYQKRLLAEAEKKVEDQKAITQTIEAEIEAAEKEERGDWDKKLQTLSSNNEVLIREIEAEARVEHDTKQAEADAYYETALADGNLAVAKSEALRNELRNAALDTTGGRIYLAQQAAENLNLESVTLNSNDPAIPSVIEIDEMVELLIGGR